MSRHFVKIWCNDRESKDFKAFISSITLDNKIEWQYSKKPEKATLWCLINLRNIDNNFLDVFQKMKKKPEVIYLERDFFPASHPSWTYFKTPLNVATLHSWIKLKFVEETQIDNKLTTNKVDIHERWRVATFRLQYWPNVTEYSSSPNIVELCSALVRDWTTYNGIPDYDGIPKELVDKLLTDAEIEGNLLYKPFVITNEVTEELVKNKPKAVEEESWGFFRSLINKLIG